jgi:hypothetical protein
MVFYRNFEASVCYSYLCLFLKHNSKSLRDSSFKKAEMYLDSEPADDLLDVVWEGGQGREHGL